jgi:hypothetical protein
VPSRSGLSKTTRQAQTFARTACTLGSSCPGGCSSRSPLAADRRRPPHPHRWSMRSRRRRMRRAVPRLAICSRKLRA